MTIKKIIIGLIVLVVVVSLIFLRKNSGIGIVYVDKDNYKLVDTYEKSGDVFRGLYQMDKNYIKLEIDKNVGEDQSKDLIKQKTTGFQNSFENNIAPYPGEVSNVTTCNEEFKPKQITINNNLFYKAYLNSRYQFGSCIQEQLVYQGVFGHVYCPKNKSLYQIEYFFDKNTTDGDKKIEDFVNSVKCSN